MVPGACFSPSLVITLLKAPEGIIAGFCLVVGVGQALGRQSFNQWPWWLALIAFPHFPFPTDCPSLTVVFSGVLWAVCWVLVYYFPAPLLILFDFLSFGFYCQLV